MADIRFFFADVTIRVPERRRLREFIEAIITRKGKKPGSLNYIFCSDEYLLNINRQYLQHDYYTDIITFDLDSDPKLVTGEIYISADRVRENAKSFGSTINHELHRIMFHGILHLCGYKDKLKAEKLAMTREEDRLLKLYFIKK